MKTKRVLALLLVLAMACALLAGCGGDEPQEPEHIELDRGAYEAYDEDDELAGYLVLTRSDLTAYDADGVLDETYEYEFDDETATYLIDGDEAFYADEDEDGVLTLTTVDDDVYTLEEIDEEDILGYTDGKQDEASGGDDTSTPVTGDDSGMASGDDSGVVSGDDSGVVSGDDGSGGIFGGGTGSVDMDTPAVDGALDTWGHYYCWEDGTFVGEIDCWGDTFYCYDTDEGATAELTVEELAGGYFTFTNVETGESQNFSASDETGELRLYSADGSYLVLVDYYSVDDPFTYDPSTGGSTSAGSFDVLSGETTPIVVADRGGVTVTAELPVEWADAGEATSSSDSSGYSVDYYDAADNNLMLMVAMGSKSDIPADTLEELAAALEEQIVGSYSDLEEFGGTTDNYYTTINGTDWYVSTIEAAYDGEAAFVLACGATVDDQACVVMCAYYGDEDSAADAGAAATAMCNTLTVG